MSEQQSQKQASGFEEHNHELHDYQGPPPPFYQRDALKELIERPAIPPLFSETLPDRRDKRLLIARRWIIIAVVIFFLFFTATLTLSILLAFATKSAPFPVSSLPDKVFHTITQTTTKAFTTTAIQTNWTTSTSIRTTTAWTSDIFTWTQDHPVTITVTSYPDPTSDPTPVARSTCETESLALANNFCVMVNSCNATQADIKANDCLNFCKPGLGLQLCQQSADPKEANCCDHCGCRT